METRNKVLTALIVLITAIVIYGIYKFINRPYMSFAIRYDQVPPVVLNFPRGKPDAYYRGLKVGKVTKIDLSKDQKDIVFNLDIYYKNLKLPKNTVTLLSSEDLYGARHFSLYYPDKPSNELISNGDTVLGTMADDRVDKVMVAEMQRGRLNEILNDLLLFMRGAKGPLTNLSRPELQRQIQYSIYQLPQTLTGTAQGLTAVNVSIPEDAPVGSGQKITYFTFNALATG